MDAFVKRENNRIAESQETDDDTGSTGQAFSETVGPSGSAEVHIVAQHPINKKL